MTQPQTALARKATRSNALRQVAAWLCTLPVAAALLALMSWSSGCAAKQKQHVQQVEDSQGDAPGLHEAFDDLPENSPFAELAILDSATIAWVERWRLMESARHSIDCVTFILSPDVFGLAFLGKLAQRAREGVQVRLLLDARGSIKFTPGMGHHDKLQALPADTTEVRLYNTLDKGLLKMMETLDLTPVVASNHDKILLVDRHTGIIGGRNIAHEYFTETDDDTAAMIDLDVSITGKEAATHMLKAFDREYAVEGVQPVQGAPAPSALEHMDLAMLMMDFWMHEPRLTDDEVNELRGSRNQQDQLQLALERGFIASLAKPLAGSGRQWVREFSTELVHCLRLRGALKLKRPESLRARTRILASSSTEGTGLNQINAALIHLTEAAKHGIIIGNPYVILTRDGLKVLAAADRRGVKTTFLTNSAASSDSLVSQALFNSRWPRMMAELPRLKVVVMGEPHAFHSKAGVFDGAIAVVGSYNLDPLSFGIDSEIVAVVWSREFAARIAALIQREIRRGEPHVYEYSIRRNDHGTPLRIPEGQVNAGMIQEERGPSTHCDKALMLKLEVAKAALDAFSGHPLLEPLM
jgi:phosphatidylserine/phosphatidylglycerophosphate/cardiolipin synthase-like enzyme